MVPVKGVVVHALGKHQNCRAVIVVTHLVIMPVKRPVDIFLQPMRMTVIRDPLGMIL